MQDLLQLMYQDGHLSSTELAALQRASRQLKENPIRILRSLNIATPSEIKELLQRYYGFSAATDKLIEELDDSLRVLMPADIALHFCVLPIADEAGDVFVLMEDPTDKGTIAQLEFLLDKKIVPVIATVQQLSSGLCRLYGVEPGRLKLSGVLETSRGAVGSTGMSASVQAHLVDDSQPLLDDEVFKKLKHVKKGGKKKTLLDRNPVATDTSEAQSVRAADAGNTPLSDADGADQDSVVHVAPSPAIQPQPQETDTAHPAEAARDQSTETQPPDLAPSSPSQTSINPFVGRELEPEFVAAINVLGLSLALAESKADAVKMINSRLEAYSFTVHLLDNSEALIVWSGTSHQLSMLSLDEQTEIPPQFRTLLKKIAQCHKA